MKTNLLRSLALLASTAALVGAPLTETTAVHTRADASSPAVTFLKAGTEPMPAAELMGSTPAGWLAVEMPGPFEAYVLNKDLTKSLNLKPGASIHLAPKADAAVLTTATKEDKATITGLQGRWTQIKLEKKIIGYIHLGGMLTTAAAGASPSSIKSGAAPAAATAPTGPMSPAPVSPAVYGVASAGQPAPIINLGDGGGSTLPRQFAGRFVSTRRPFSPRRPYDWALADAAGKRYAYLDVSKLLLTEQIETYANREIVVFGAAKTEPGGKDIVVRVETLQLK